MVMGQQVRCHVCRMERNPISAPNRLGAAATSSRVWELASNSRSSSGLREVSASGFSSWGQGEDNVEVVGVQQIALLDLEPSPASLRLALGTASRSA
jgi:hypothetical protein